MCYCSITNKVNVLFLSGHVEADITVNGGSSTSSSLSETVMNALRRAAVLYALRNEKRLNDMSDTGNVD